MVRSRSSHKSRNKRLAQSQSRKTQSSCDRSTTLSLSGMHALVASLAVLGCLLALISYLKSSVNHTLVTPHSVLHSSVPRKSDGCNGISSKGTHINEDHLVSDLSVKNVARIALGLLERIRFSFGLKSFTLFDLNSTILARQMCGMSSKVNLFRSDWNTSHLRDFYADGGSHHRSSMEMKSQHWINKRSDFASLMDIHQRSDRQLPPPVDLSGYDHCCNVLNLRMKGMNVSMPKVTVVINTWRREDCLMLSLRRWVGMGSVHNIVVISADPETEQRWNGKKYLDRLFKQGYIRLNKKLVHLHRSVLGSDKLSDRFKFDPSIMADVVFSVDDDLRFNWDVFRGAVKLYARINEGRKHKHIAVGFDPNQRLFRFSQVSHQSPFLAKDTAYFRELAKQGVCVHNAVFLTLGGLMHKEYFLAFHNDPRMKPVREMIDEFVTGEDIAMSLLYSSMHDGRPPLVLLSEQTYYLLQCSQSMSSKMHNPANIARRIAIANFTAQMLGFSPEGGLSLKNSSTYVRLDWNSAEFTTEDFPWDIHPQ